MATLRAKRKSIIPLYMAVVQWANSDAANNRRRVVVFSAAGSRPRDNKPMPETARQTIADFLAQKRIAVVGASRDPKDFNGAMFRTLRERGYDAVPVNPNATEIDGARCFARVQEIQPPVQAALLLTAPEVTDKAAQDCHEAGVNRVWLYGVAGTPNSPRAAEFCRANGMAVVSGYCPHMFLGGTPWFHRFHGLILKIAGRYPAA